MKSRWITIMAVLAAVAAISVRADPPSRDGLVAHYYKDHDNWKGLWPDSQAEPNSGTDPAEWTFTAYTYSRVEPAVNHLFIKKGWFSIRWVGYIDPSQGVPDAPNALTIGGTININPNNSAQNEFTAVTPGGTISRADLKAAYPGYEGAATSVHVKPKGNGDQGTLIVNGLPYPVVNAETYDITSSKMKIKIYNDSIAKGKAMGDWWIAIDATDAKIVSSADVPPQAQPQNATVGGKGGDPAGSEYFFEIWADDGCRLMIDGHMLIDSWRPSWERRPDSVRKSSTVKLTDGQHRIVVEYFQGQSLEGDDNDPMKLYWTCPSRGIMRQVVPPACFSHSTEDLTSPDRK